MSGSAFNTSRKGKIMQMSKINYVAESTFVPVINAVEKTVSKAAKSAPKVEDSPISRIEVPFSKVSTVIDPNVSYALSHGNIIENGVGEQLYIFV